MYIVIINKEKKHTKMNIVPDAFAKMDFTKNIYKYRVVIN